MAKITFRAGRLPDDRSRPRVFFSRFWRTSYLPPEAADYYTGVASWGMLGNDRYGDCVFASNGHLVEQQTALGDHAEAGVTTTQALAEYTRVTGFNPNDPNTDNGSTVQAGLHDLTLNGLAGKKIAAYAQLNHQNLGEVKTAVAQLGAVDVGCVITQSAMDQFNAGQPWDYTGDNTPMGGHCILLTGYDSTYLYFVTWGKVQKATYAWWNNYVEEAWAVISADWADQGAGPDPEGVDLHALGEEFAQLTGQANPFPSPSPTPPPTPTPTPPPAPVPPSGPGCLPGSKLLARFRARHKRGNPRKEAP